VVRSWEVDAPWAAQQLVAATFGPGGGLFLLTATRTLFWLQLDGGDATSSSSGEGLGGALTAVSLKRHHGCVRCLAFDERSGTLLIAGDGSSSATATATSSSSAAAAAGVTLSLWQVGGRELKLRASYGKPRGAGVIAGLVGGALGAYSLPPRPWRVSVSPLGEYAAVVTHTHR